MTGVEIVDRLDPALRHLVAARTDLSEEQLPAVRAFLNQRRADGAAQLDTAGVDIEDAVAFEEVPVRIYRGGADGAVVYCHSGAFVLGNLDTDHLQCVELARRAAVTVISVDYRLAPEHPYPAGFDDALAVLHWTADNAARWGVAADRLAVAGSSAGGALAAGLAQRSADGSAPPLRFQLLHQPVLDDGRTPSKQEFTHTPGFDGPAAALMWRHYLAGERPPAGAVPARTVDLTGLAPAFISCSELDPLRDEAVDYALRLMWAGVPTELHVVPGTCHGFDSLVPGWELSTQMFERHGAALRRALAVS
ncbi:alpha/beta hydrolase [Mycolicibacterium frederiksbergense]|uniref:alpha/beta hydrolase n=1 Tax=Mycolicibacterium frederiksbergense TaxID=117567 RepID=UPI00265B734A|nr:alpha/beta hydrolase [Mycolicibacterium frederiksbergense]MDO0977355.1 alpha/beta hydrolase [Mycolicibacterium frederiksbergense]